MAGLKKGLFVILALQVIIVTQPACAAGEWTKELSLGYNKTSGNTEKAEFSTAGMLNRKTTSNEITLKGDVYYSSADKNMDAQKWSGLGRYAYSFGEQKKWFNSYQLQADHDRFADVDYRLLPTVGIGYWFSDTDDWKFMAEGSAGLEMTNYRSNKADDEEAAAIGHLYAEKKIFDRARASEDFSIIPSLEEGDFRIKSETAFTNPIKEGLDLSIKFIIDYDSDPADGIEDTDTRLVTGLKYSF